MTTKKTKNSEERNSLGQLQKYIEQTIENLNTYVAENNGDVSLLIRLEPVIFLFNTICNSYEPQNISYEIYRRAADLMKGFLFSNRDKQYYIPGADFYLYPEIYKDIALCLLNASGISGLIDTATPPALDKETELNKQLGKRPEK